MYLFRKVVREELESFKNGISITLPYKSGSKESESVYGDIVWLMKLKNVGRQTVYSWTHSKKIPHYKTGKKLYFKKDEIYNWMKEGKMETVEEIQREAINELSKVR